MVIQHDSRASGTGTAGSATSHQPSLASVLSGQDPIQLPQGENQTGFQLEEHPIDEFPSIKVAVIGAGITGITCGVFLPVKVPGIDLTIFEKNSDVGGTWFENIYPGVRCDVPANVYQSTFEPRTQWTEEFAQGREIRDYWQSVAKKYDVYKYLSLNTEVKQAQWDETSAKWVVNSTNLSTGETRTEQYDIVITAIGRFNAWKLPNIPGISDYKGHLRHSSNWDPSFDPTGKRVAVIGNGASGIQVVPELQRVVSRLDHYARSKTWISGTVGAAGERTLAPKYFPKEKLESFEDPNTYYDFRKQLENKFFARFGGFFKGADKTEKSRAEFTRIMADRLQKKPHLLEHILPDFSPSCRRLTPGPGYLEAIAEDNVDFIRTPIERFTATGIRTVDGTERDVDAIICSTGANVDLAPPFSIIAGDTDLKTAWKPDGKLGFPYTYLGVAAPSFPNLFFLHGPNSSGPSGTFPSTAEAQITYLAKVLRKVQRQGIRTIVPQQKAVDDFVELIDAFFPRTVMSENCSSWANGGRPGARIHGYWPGSALHTKYAKQDPRWEDFEYTYRSPSGNRFAYFGNGWTKKELIEGADLTPYLRKPEDIDLRSYHELWHDV
ncbi:FAD/NAD(P)-binding domain-containing protein [Xylona heveae TC161]|uniref:FAD/NAD(P)-binding domain-containing protein n=1 Tax=Xylona heveae (strain CBS 132557 / TC161) TaxID=1328760 RepID=A0A164ZEF6_XYLHT|nr:FAD/NAD(P)-binding domain-containing protein [Xylona heveae TC161]KZF18996.1 FAD/NAD(P)-binding domain-containing protein [Xylona heveae TC161]